MAGTLMSGFMSAVNGAGFRANLVMEANISEICGENIYNTSLASFYTTRT